MYTSRPIGRIEAAQGPVIDVRCDYLPPLGQALEIVHPDGRRVMIVSRHVDQAVVRHRAARGGRAMPRHARA
ncbi:MAG: hypothetical protein JNJ60_19045 [Rhodocyclaceae bacterium]|nr:hypothetical protein [Rhodocyclaceae bacterium]